MPARKHKKGAFGKGNEGYGLRNADADAADEPDAGARANECRPVALHTHTHDPHECTRTHTHTHARTHTHTHAHTHTHTRTHTANHYKTHAHTNLRAHALTRAHSKHTMPLARSLASMGAHAPAHPARWTTCADELLQLRQPLEAQGVELQQLRLSTAALFAAAEATASRNRDTSTLRKQRAIKSATNDTTGWPSCSKSGRKGKMCTSDSGPLSLR
jgi:hypothetical protein